MQRQQVFQPLHWMRVALHCLSCCLSGKTLHFFFLLSFQFVIVLASSYRAIVSHLVRLCVDRPYACSPINRTTKTYFDSLFSVAAIAAAAAATSTSRTKTISLALLADNGHICVRFVRDTHWNVWCFSWARNHFKTNVYTFQFFMLGNDTESIRRWLTMPNNAPQMITEAKKKRKWETNSNECCNVYALRYCLYLTVVNRKYVCIPSRSSRIVFVVCKIGSQCHLCYSASNQLCAKIRESAYRSLRILNKYLARLYLINDLHI